MADSSGIEMLDSTGQGAGGAARRRWKLEDGKGSYFLQKSGVCVDFFILGEPFAKSSGDKLPLIAVLPARYFSAFSPM
jgi:hypothetical protein